ncbi:hypothetical protein [Paraburkholderia sp. J67]|uniref:hypothetical protein n=1 Tax=Paraburkholderia sp. J67 TaxID=2805435 RepID=UPI002ABE8F25|nr:hypothetical protein [Paraburkholderia sp. J67]
MPSDMPCIPAIPDIALPGSPANAVRANNVAVAALSAPDKNVLRFIDEFLKYVCQQGALRSRTAQAVIGFAYIGLRSVSLDLGFTRAIAREPHSDDRRRQWRRVRDADAQRGNPHRGRVMRQHLGVDA